MRFLRLKLAAFATAALVTACGGGGDGLHFSSFVNFGDSLSDVGTYRVGTVAAVGGGKWTINSSAARNWTESLAASAGVAAPCPAQTGMSPNIPGLVGGTIVNHPECTNYAQGSSRVSGIYAPNSATLQPLGQFNLGFMAVPITVQMDTHLSKIGGHYQPNDLVTVLGGGNDAFMNINAVGAAAAGGAGAAGAAFTAGWPTSVQNAVAAGGAAAVNAAATQAVTSMGAAGAELAGLIKSKILANGARYVVVVNLPDVSQSAFALTQDAQTRGLINTMVTTFNSQLAAGLSGSGVLLVDAYTQGRLQTASPAQFGLTNVTTPACSTTSPNNPLQGASLTCTPNSLIPGDTSGYLFADSVHPTPLGYELIANHVRTQMHLAGWL
ncbi:MAG TPA: SGNH/GDSL hydrolase family protein [Ramlibacter sp.]|nr:SGNH/GDSL hydrolase family protein [Ramlibacter sp.]